MRETNLDIARVGPPNMWVGPNIEKKWNSYRDGNYYIILICFIPEVKAFWCKWYS